jgi:hypothetical protein
VSDDQHDDPTSAAKTADAAPETGHAPAPAATGEQLAGLMASGTKAAGATTRGKPAPDLEGQALRAAEQALADGERAIAAARAHLRDEPAAVAAPAPRRGRELALRALLAVNVLAMLFVALMPPGAATTTPPPPATTPAPAADDVAVRRFNEPFNNALAAADRGAHTEAIAILEQYLGDNPRMLPSQKLNVLNMLSHYAGLANDFARSQRYAQQAAAIGQSHSLPADLVEMARQAVANGDQETLRRVWARFLLQQRQIPSWLYKHVAEAYLQLGDSYRGQADAAAEKARLQELQENAMRLREQALTGQEQGK